MACAAASLNDKDVSVDAGASPKAPLATTADALPDQVLYLVLQFLKARELGGVACVSKAFNDVAKDTRLWRSLQFQDDQYNLTATQATRVISMASTRFSPAQLDGIRSIDFTGCIRLDDSAIDAVRARCPRLEEFRLGGTLGFRVKLVTARALVALVESCTLLSALELRGVTQLSDEAVQAMCSFPHTRERLRHLRLWSLRLVDPDTPRAIGGLVGLKTLNLIGCCRLPHSGIVDMLRVGATDEGDPPRQQLEELWLGGVHFITDSAIATLAQEHGSSLRTLDVSGCRLLTDDALMSVGADDGDGAVAPCLTKVFANSCSRLRDNGFLYLSQTVGAQLTHFHAARTKLTEAALREMLGRMPLLEQLNLDDVPSVTDSVIEVVASTCARLERLSIGGRGRKSTVTDASIGFLANSAMASTLGDLNVCGCTDVSLLAITTLVNACPALHKLDVRQTSASCDALVSWLMSSVPGHAHAASGEDTRAGAGSGAGAGSSGDVGGTTATCGGTDGTPAIVAVGGSLPTPRACTVPDGFMAWVARQRTTSTTAAGGGDSVEGAVGLLRDLLVDADTVSPHFRRLMKWYQPGTTLFLD